MKSKILKIALIIAVAAIACTFIFIAINNAPITPEINSKSNTADDTTYYTPLQNSTDLLAWLKQPTFNAQLVTGATYEINIEGFSSVQLGKKLEGNGATIIMKSNNPVNLNNWDNSNANHGLLFRKLTSGGSIKNVKITNNVTSTLTFELDSYWQGTGTKGQGGHYIGTVIGRMDSGAVLENCELTFNGNFKVNNNSGSTRLITKKQVYAFVATFVGYNAGEIINCTVNDNGTVDAQLTADPNTNAWHVWNTLVTTFVGKLEGSSAKMINNTVSIGDNAVKKSFGTNEGGDLEIGNKIGFYVGQYVSGTINGVLFKKVPANTNFTHSGIWKRTGNTRETKQDGIFMYSIYNRPDASYLYRTQDVNLTGYNGSPGVTLNYTQIDKAYYPRFVAEDQGVIELDLTNHYSAKPNQIAYSINGLTCYEQVSNGKVLAKKWRSAQHSGITIVDATLGKSVINVESNANRRYSGQEINDFSGIIKLTALQSNDTVYNVIANKNYIPTFNAPVIKDAATYELTGARLIENTKILAQGTVGTAQFVWTTDLIDVDQSKNQFTISRAPLSFTPYNGSIYNASLVLNSGLVTGDTVEVPINDNVNIHFNQMGAVRLNDVKYTGILGQNTSIGANYYLSNDLNINVTPHIINIPENVEVLINDESEMEYDSTTKRLNIKKLVEEVNFRAIVLNYGYSYSNWRAIKSGSAVQNVLSIGNSTNSRVNVKLTDPSKVDTISVTYGAKTFTFNASIIGKNSAGETVQNEGAVSVVHNGQPGTANFTGKFGDQLVVKAMIPSNYIFLHWSNGSDNKVYAYSQEITFKLYQSYNLTAHFVAKDAENTAKLVYHDIAGTVLHEKLVAPDNTLMYYMGRDEVVYPYEELYKVFREWKATEDATYVLQDGDEIKIYPVFFTTKTLSITDNTNTVGSGTYYFNHTITLKQGDYTINGFKVTAPKNGLKFNLINNITIDYAKSSTDTTADSLLISQMVMENNSWYFIATVPSKKDYKFAGFTLRLENALPEISASYEIKIKRYIRYGDIDNGYIYQFIVKLDKDLIAYIGNDVKLILKSDSTIIGEV